MSRYCRQAPTAALAALVLAGCGTASQAGDTAVRPATVPGAHPHVIQPIAGVQSADPAGGSSAPVGDPSAHAPSLAEVKRELKVLNFSGGSNSSAVAQHEVQASVPVITHEYAQIQQVLLLPYN